MKKLPVFKEYIVDVHLKQFRKIDEGLIEFIDFNSVKGETILNNYIKSLKRNNLEFKNFIKHFNP